LAGHPADIIREYELGGGIILNGRWGLNPRAVMDYYSGRGFTTRITMLPDRTPVSIDDQIRSSRVSILTYRNNSAVHTVAVYFDEASGMFRVFNGDGDARGSTIRRNDRNEIIGPGEVPSIDEWIQTDDRVRYAVSIVTIR
jgi:hypothetical protein